MKRAAKYLHRQIHKISAFFAARLTRHDSLHLRLQKLEYRVDAVEQSQTHSAWMTGSVPGYTKTTIFDRIS